jgi:hypothetical protein
MWKPTSSAAWPANSGSIKPRNAWPASPCPGVPWDAHVIANVDFGWGILGKLDKGGTIQLEQSDIGGGDWELTSLKLSLKGKALMLKSLDIQLTEQASHFSEVPAGTDYRKAIELLENSGAPVSP